MNNLPNWTLRWREHRNSRPYWHDLPQKTRQHMASVTELPHTGIGLDKTLSQLAGLANAYLEAHPEADAVLIEYSTDHHHGRRGPDGPYEQHRIRLGWFADRFNK